MKSNIKKIVLIIVPILLFTIVFALICLYERNPTKNDELDIELFKGLLQFGIFGLLTIFVKYVYEEAVLKIKKEEELEFKKYELRKSSLDSLVGKRIESFKAFWNLSEELRNNTITNKVALLKLKEWYFDKGFGMFISHSTMKLYREMKYKLEKSNFNYEDREELISKMRTRLKVDIGVYTEEESTISTRYEEK